MKKDRLLLALIVLLGAIVRLYKWNSYGFWYDEVNWLAYPKEGLLNILIDTARILKPPFFRFLLYFWSLLGKTEFFLKLLPAIFGIAIIPLIYKLGSDLFDKRTGIIASLLLSISPFHIYYSQELTHYTLTTFLALASIFFLVRMVRGNKTEDHIGYILATSLSLYTNYICILLLIAQNIFFICFRKKYANLIRTWLIEQLLIVLLFSPWLLIANKQIQYLAAMPDLTKWYDDLWGRDFLWLRILQLMRLFNSGYNANFTINSLVSLLFFPLFIFGVSSVMKQKNADHITKILIFWLIIPIIFSMVFAKIQPSFTYRNFIFILPAYYIVIAYGMTRIKQLRYTVPLVLLCTIALLSFSLANYFRNIFPYPEYFYRPGVHPKIDLRSASQYIVNNRKDGELIVHASIATGAPHLYYLSLKTETKIMPWVLEVPPSSKNCVTVYKIEELPQIIKGYKVAWFILSSWEPQDLKRDVDREENKFKEFFDRRFPLLAHKQFTGIDLYLYALL
jgi:4-amino-4-deoxy-L-arabinose transferase-like glycosyltransferase